MSRMHAPLYEALKRHLALNPRSFHVPGHQYGLAMKLFPNQIADELRQIMQLDVTELSSTDDLHDPQGAIREAQQLAAKTFGADETFFLVGGSTAGNIALVLAHCKQGDMLIVQRNVHKSIINGLMLAGARAVFVNPEVNSHTGLPTVPSLENLEQALRQYPESKAVMLSTPNYYGMGVDLPRYAETVHSFGKPLIVDEAHGAHYGLHEELPEGALAAGADAVVQSTHKTLPALTMGAMLHLKGKLANRTEVKRILAMIQSSSPSYPIMVSLDLTRAMIDLRGPLFFDNAISLAKLARRKITESAPVLSVIDEQVCDTSYHYTDPLRIVLWDRSGRMTGFDLQRQLERFGIFAEMADPRHVVLLVGLSASMEDVEALVHACCSIAPAYEPYSRPNSDGWISMPRRAAVSKPVLLKAGSTDPENTVTVPLSEAEGLICGEMIIPYPPGIPILYPGEIILPEVKHLVRQLAEHGTRFQSASDPTLATIRVFTGSGGFPDR